MVILDTDHMSMLQRGGSEGRRIRLRLLTLPPGDVSTTIISYEEQTRGWLARIARLSSLEQQATDYSELKKLLRNYCNIGVRDFEAGAINEFRRLQTMRVRVGTMDLKIAAITLANNATLLTRNSADFGKVPAFRTEDWSA
jgi:tRNA(fMet)-specific endonuclease VapC